MGMKKRPTFYFNDNPDQPVRAGGLVFYVKTKKGPKILMARCQHTWSDLGGKTDVRDTTITDTIVREFNEESNCMLYSQKRIKSKPQVLEVLPLANEWLKTYLEEQPVHSYYIASCKYVLYVVELPKSYLNKTWDMFDRREYYESITRKVDWLNEPGLMNLIEKKKMHCRLPKSTLMEMIEQMKG
jgi:hypothetical protein